MILDTVIYNFHSWKECSGKIHIKVKNVNVHRHHLFKLLKSLFTAWNWFSYFTDYFTLILELILICLSFSSLTVLKYLKWILKCLIKVLGTYLILIVNVQTITVLSFCVGVPQSNCWCWLKSPIGSIEILGKCDNQGFHQHTDSTMVGPVTYW